MFKPSGALDSKSFEQKTAEELLDELCDFLSVLNDEINEIPKSTNEGENVFYIANAAGVKAKISNEDTINGLARVSNIDIDEEIEDSSAKKGLKTYKEFCLETGNFGNIIMLIKRLPLKTSAYKSRGENYEIFSSTKKEIDEYVEMAKRVRRRGDVPFWIKTAMDTFISCFSVFDCKDDNEQKGRTAVAMRCVIQTIADKKMEDDPEGANLPNLVMQTIEDCRKKIFDPQPELNRLKRVQ